MRIDVESYTIDRRIITKTINSDDFTDSPERSLGRTLPIVIGEDIQVKPYRVTTDASPTYAYATTLSTEHIVGGIQKYYASDQNGDYQEVNSVTSTSSVYYELASTTGSALAAADHSEAAYEFTPTNSFIATSYDISFKHFGGTWESIFEIRIYSHNEVEDMPNQQIAISTLDITDYADPGTGNTTVLSLPFETPLVLRSDSIYWVSIIRSEYTTQTDVVIPQDTCPAISYRFRARNNFESKWSGTSNSTTTRPNIGLYGVRFVDSTSSAAYENGLGYASFEASQRSIAGFTMPDLTKLEYVVEIDGLKDDSGGSITGSASLQIARPDHAIKLLSQSYNGSTWGSPTIDNSQFTLTPFTSGVVKTAGATSGRTSVSKAIEDICRSAQARIAERADGLEIYSENVTQTSAATITDEDSFIISVREDPIDATCINDIEMYYTKKLITADIVSGTSEGTLTQYVSRYLMSDPNTDSGTLFGKRVLQTNTFDFINEATTAQNIASTIINKWAMPQVYVTAEVPLSKYSNLDILDVVEILHPDLPAFFGTSYNAKLPSYDGGVIAQGGMYEKRAKRYRAQIEARQIVYRKEHPALMQIVCRLLLNAPYDPT